jgi:hypothetical protein
VAKLCRSVCDHRRKAVAAVGYLSHRGSLPMVSPPSYPVILTKPLGVLILQHGKGTLTIPRGNNDH